MKKIYSKMTKNRREFCQIETYITQDEKGKKMVYKRALTEEGKAHVNRIYEHYQAYENKEAVCAVFLIEDGVVAFPFIRGESLCKEMIRCLENRDRNGFENKLQMYGDLVNSTAVICDKPEVENKECRDIFGVGQWNYDGKYAIGLNIDMCFDNIIHTDGKYVVIDCEWIFDIPLPINFVVYRSIWALYVRYNDELRGMYSWMDLYKFFGITESQVCQYENMNRCFNDYVYGGKKGYSGTLSQYTKTVYNIPEIYGKISKAGNYMQIFADYGQGYSEEYSKMTAISLGKVSVNVDVSEFCEAEELRIDPSIYPFICKGMLIEIADKFGNEYTVEQYDSIGCMQVNDWMIFVSNDPQIKFANRWKKEIATVKVSFDMLRCLTESEVQILSPIQKRDEKLLSIKHELEGRLTTVVSEVMLREYSE